MDGHQLRGARIHRDMLLVSSVCRRALGCEWGEEVGLSVVSGGGEPRITLKPDQVII